MMDPKTIEEAVRNAAKTRGDGRLVLPCAVAFELAREKGIDILEIGRVCNANNIKIVQCQLGCFS